MGIMDLEGMDVPDNKGGRPPKNDDNYSEDRGVEHAYTPGLDSEEWWLDRVNDRTSPEELEEMDMFDRMETIGLISHDTASDPFFVRRKLAEHGIYDTDWDTYIEWRREDTGRGFWDCRIPQEEVSMELIPRGVSTSSKSSSSSGGFLSGATGDDDDDGIDTNTGLGGLLQDAKDGS